jgi:predicted permease
MKLRYALRRLVRAPGFTAAATITLALGIGSTTAIFSVIEAVILRPLPYPEPARLIAMDHSVAKVGLSNVNGAPFLYYTYRENAHSWAGVASYDPGTLNITGVSRPERVEALSVTHELLPMLGVAPLLGRTFSEAEDTPTRPQTVVLSWAYWQTRFGGARDVIGKRIVGDGEAREIIGVMPRDFHFLNIKADVFVPMRNDRAKVHLGQFGMAMVGRLKPGITLEQASAEGKALAPIAIQKFPPFQGASKSLYEKLGLKPVFTPLQESLVGDSGRFLWILMGTISIVLLIACANVANLMLVRADGRRQELAVRAALGAGARRIAGELLADSGVLAGIGGTVGIGLAWMGLRLLRTIGPQNVPRLDEASLDAPVLIFAVAITTIAALLFGMLPAIRYAGSRLSGGLRSGGRTASESRERHRARGVLVVVQVALALVLAIAAGLMIRTFDALHRVAPGFTRPDQMQTFRIAIPEVAVPNDAAAARMLSDILEKVKATPGVQTAALHSNLPMLNNGWTDGIYIEGRTYSEAQLPPLSRFRFASPGMPTAMGTSILAGRDLTWTDIFELRPVALVNEVFAKRNWGSAGAAIGKRFRDSLQGQWREIAGVVADEYTDGLAKPAPTAVYYPLMAANLGDSKTLVFRSPFVVVRTARAGSTALMDDLRKAVWSVNADLPLAEVRTMREIYDKSSARTSFTLVMLTLAGGMALLLSLVGVYGVISYSVARRTREIGIRSALGARPEQLVRSFAQNGVQLAAIGVVCGGLAAWYLTRFLQSLLFGVKTTDPMTWAAVIPALFMAATLASWLPARRTVRVDPTEALRSE